MSVEILKNYLITNPDEIVKILELTDFHNISFSEEKGKLDALIMKAEILLLFVLIATHYNLMFLAKVLVEIYSI